SHTQMTITQFWIALENFRSLPRRRRELAPSAPMAMPVAAQAASAAGQHTAAMPETGDVSGSAIPSTLGTAEVSSPMALSTLAIDSGSRDG
ncbi:MAG: hypothetical protein M1115_00005, partial [Actinobacteria bacterium]|nr:hypothetical protein [Actinomycetota bacterium]